MHEAAIASYGLHKHAWAPHRWSLVVYASFYDERFLQLKLSTGAVYKSLLVQLAMSLLVACLLYLCASSVVHMFSPKVMESLHEAV